MESYNTLTQYKVFHTVAILGNISKAAEKLYISQPAISKSLKQLEENLGVRLFNRNSRGVSLTEEGTLLFKHIHSAFEEISKGEDTLHRMTSLGLGTLRISASSTLCKYILLPYLKGFIRENPHIKINIECHSTTQSLELLEAGQTDIGLVGHTPFHQKLTFLSIGYVNYVFTATDSYLSNLRTRGIQTIEEIFENANIMLLDQDNVSRLHVDNFLESIGLKPQNILEVNNMELLIDFAKIDLGIACIISDFIRDDLQKQRLTEIPLPAAIPPRKIGFAYNETSISSAAVNKFIQYLKKHTKYL
ncbi:MAG: LysR family transcriptional regulator [Lachnospiraceae bacterium]|nr:LysR family transcriptional regulator [Lachnospiraceae bacterium]